MPTYNRGIASVKGRGITKFSCSCYSAVPGVPLRFWHFVLFKVLTVASVSGEDEETAGHRQIQFDGGETLAEQLLALSVVCGYFE